MVDIKSLNMSGIHYLNIVKNSKCKSRIWRAPELNERETVDFLTIGKLNIHLGTVDEKGHPNVHPAWYYFDPVNNRIYVETSKQVKDIQP